MEKWPLEILALLVLCGLVSPLLADNGGPDAILQFYCEQARLKVAAQHPYEQALTYSFRATTYRHNMDDSARGDSAVIDYFFSNGTLDSQRTVESTSWQPKGNDVFYPNVFDLDYQYTFYPNDTGGKDLAIGFDRDTVGDQQPVGLAIIDRYDYHLRRLYLFYPNKPGFRRFTRLLHFQQQDGYLFPVSIVESASKDGVFSTEHYRVETVFSEITIAGHPSPAQTD
jgi:hypothetical protein